MKPEEKRYQTLRGNEGWHTDSSYMPLAAKASALAAEVTPSKGGETELADMRDAYDTLDEEVQRSALPASPPTTRFTLRRRKRASSSKPGKATATTPKGRRSGRWSRPIR